MTNQTWFARPDKPGEMQLTTITELVYVYPDADPGHGTGQHTAGQHGADLVSQLARISSSSVSALSSLVFSASASSLTRICLALASMRFSPADRPRALSLRQRSLTTSATLFTSPEAS